MARRCRIILILWLCVIAAPALAADEIPLGVATTLGLLEGRESLEAVRLAVEEINARGGVSTGGKTMTFRVEPFDLGDAMPGVSVSDALLSLRKFITERGIRAVVVGPFRSEVLLPAMDLIAELKVPMLGTIAMTPVTDLKIVKDPRYRYVFRVGLNSRYLVAYLIQTMKFLNGRLGLNKVFIMHQDVAWTRATASQLIRIFFNREGWRVLGVENYASGASDFSWGLAKARERGAEVILPLFDMPQSSYLVKQWHEMRVPVLLAGFISPMIGPTAWQTFEGEIAGTLNVVFELGNLPSERYLPALDFYEAFRERYGREIEAGHGPAPAYESVYILRDAIRRAGSLDRDELVSALEKTDRIGTMGRIRFNRGHQAIFGADPGAEALACVFQWDEGGKRRIVYPPCIADGEIDLPDFFRR